MKKLNNKGFAITTIIYGTFILFIMILAILLTVMDSSILLLDDRVNNKNNYLGTPNPPDLENTGLIPVVYNDNAGFWVVADVNSKWYDYDNQWWANAIALAGFGDDGKPLRNHYINEDGTYKSGKLVSLASAFYVWIPRFSYTIGCHEKDKCYGYRLNDGTDPDSLSSELPGAIDIKFVDKDTTDTLDLENDFPSYNYTSDKNRKSLIDNWYTHPAFTFGDDELSGIWVGKFETSVDNNSECYTNLVNKDAEAAREKCIYNNVYPMILPDRLSLVNQNIFNQYMTAKIFTSNTLECDGVKCNEYYGLNGDSHMMKNSEWGAVAYLSQSIYGKYGNPNYERKNKEIYKNDSGRNNNYDKFYWTGYTGRSQGSAPATSNYSEEGTYKYNNIEIVKNEDGTYSYGKNVPNSGTGASTTGNIYGIYDMSGGAAESVMGYYIDASSEFGGYTYRYMESNDSGFANETKPKSKYFDEYKKIINEEKTNEEIGHAMSETKEWYESNADSITAIIPWIIRGDYVNSSKDIGIFSFNSTIGGKSNISSFRTVLVNAETS